eukprot:14171610-Alexandrium_andersonii.AAC.1
MLLASGGLSAVQQVEHSAAYPLAECFGGGQALTLGGLSVEQEAEQSAAHPLARRFGGGRAAGCR